MLTTQTTSSSAAALSARLSGDAYAPGDPGYDEARQGFVLSVDLRPAIVALPETADDVVAIVNHAREHGLRIAPQGTGHNAYPLADLGSAILVKTSRMRGVEIDAERKVARAEAGAWWIDVSAPASELGLAPLAGSSPDVGVVGYTLGGGVSWLGRKYGLGANNVVAIEVVTPDGRLVRADHENEPDLFWALRGGGGNFGVVTAIELRLFELPELYAGVVFFGIDRAAEVLKAWREWVRTVPDEATSIGRVLNIPDIPEAPEIMRGKSFVTIEMAYAGDPAAGEALIAPIRALGPEIDMFAPMPPVGLARLHMDPEGAMPSGLSDTRLYTDALDDEAIDHILSIVGAGTDSPLVLFELRHIGGALGRRGPGHGALDRLDGEFLAFGLGMPMDEASGALIEASLRRAYDGLRRYETGRQYLNFAERETAAGTFFDEPTLARLRQVRAHVDPHGLMRANHEIRSRFFGGSYARLPEPFSGLRKTCAPSMRILVVDDEPAVRGALERALRLDGYDVGLAEDGLRALDALAGHPPDAVVLDVAMPGVDGLEVCRRMRAGGDRTPVLMLTARDAIDDRVAGLDAGADDYLVKPFALRELRARLRALLRRAEPPSEALAYADLRMNVTAYEVTRGERRIALTRTEFSLLRLFLEHPGQVLTRGQIFERVWGYDFGATSNTLGVYVGYLRRKLEEGGEPRLVHTVRGVGYILRAP